MGPTARARRSRRLRALVSPEGGFTLVELIMAMAILLIVVASLSAVLVSATRTQVDANKRFQAQEQARTGLAQLTRELHCASSVTQTSGAALAAGTAYTAITANLPSTCATSGGTTLYVTWCTSPITLTTGGHAALYRVTSTSAPSIATPLDCNTAGKVKRSDYLTTTTPFCLPSTTTACGVPAVFRPSSSLPMLHVTMPVNVNGLGSTIQSYNVVDDIALRNGAHS
jgi:prepilin-type N-terminal cleavage/methylation domain-containing protein